MLGIFDDAVDDEWKRPRQRERTDAGDQSEDEGHREARVIRPRLT